jgi:DNA-binding LytR/AlgR family response regulator
MNALNTLVVEDEGLARRRLESLVSEQDTLALIQDSAVNGREAIDKIKKYSPDLLLMDIQLKDFDSFEVIERTRFHVKQVIFVTAYNTYAIKAFDIDAVDYLLKPFTKERFNSAIQKLVIRNYELGLKTIENILADYSSLSNGKVVIPEGNTRHLIEENQIDYIYSQGYYVNFVMTGQKKLVRISLKSLEDILSPYFLRINKSTIINSTKIKQLVQYKISLKVIMYDHNEFFVSANYKEGLGTLLNIV